MTRIGAIFHPNDNPIERLPEAARAAEEAGLAELWLWEDCFLHAGFSAAAIALSATSRLRVGIGISPMPMRNAAATAMEIATLARAFPGRLLPGLGHGVQGWMRQIGAKPASPLTLMREYVPAVRELLAGAEVSVEGRYVRLDAVRPDWPPSDVPLVYAAATGPKTLALAGAVADGVVLDSGRSPEEVGEQVRAVRQGWADASRPGSPDIVAYVEAPLAGGARTEAVAETVWAFAEVGVDDVVFLPERGADPVEVMRAAGAVSGLI